MDHASPSNPGVLEWPSLKETAAWDAPILFDDIETPDIPACLLPGVFREFSSALAKATETPEALAVLTVLGVLSAVLARHVIISPIEGWHEPINIYTLIALPPANHKSLVLRHCTQPLMDWEKKQSLQLEPEIKRLSSERKTQEKIIENLRIKAAKTIGYVDQQELIRSITEKEMTLPKIPVLPVIFTNDATPESLATLVHEQGGRLAIFSDEGGIIETLAGLYSNGLANVDILLKGIDGGELRIRRKDRSIALNPFLTIILTVQPSIIQNMGSKSAYLGNGALERFLYAVPKSKLGYRQHDSVPVPTNIQKNYHDKITELLSALQNKSRTAPLLLKLAPDSYHAWRQFQASIEKQLRPEGNLSLCVGWGGKICGFALRLAGLLHIAEYGLGNMVINHATVQNALAIAELLTEHAIAAFGLMGVDQITADAKTIFQWIISQQHPFFSRSDILLAMRGKKLGRTDRLNKALQVLHERSIISPPIKVPTRKPTIRYQVNPQLIKAP